MKEIIAIIRPKMVGPTKRALEAIGFPSLTAVSVIGRGRQRGIAGEVGYQVSPEFLAHGRSAGMKYIPKRLISIVVGDVDVDWVVQTIVQINQTARIGDGKIFICPVENVVRVRTDEEGEKAIM